MNLSKNTQAILLLTGYFESSSSSSSTNKPLTVGEWSRFADFLKRNELLPSQLLEIDYLKLLNDLSDKTITAERISALLRRGSAMAVALEKWNRVSIWVISRADKEYPSRLKKKLGQNSPPILFGCGNKALLNRGGIGVVGSRDVPSLDIDYTNRLARKVAEAGYSIISGCAKGVDQTAMMAALEAKGTVIGIMADSLYRASSSRQYRQYIMDNNLALITPFYPEAGFSVGNAMQRNKYIYCLSDAAVAVHSGKPEGKKSGGGTWTGALENLKKEWVPLWVNPTGDYKAGNALIVEKGACWLNADVQQVQVDNLLKAPTDQVLSVSEDLLSESEVKPGLNIKVESLTNESVIEQHEDLEVAALYDVPETFYDFFLVIVKPLLLKEAKAVNELVEVLEISKSQINIWLKKAVEEKKLTKLKKPVRYQWLDETKQHGLF